MNFDLQKFVEDEMLHKNEKLNESLNEDLMEDINEDELAEAALNEDDDAPAEQKTMSEEELKIESLKIATNIAKLMSDVTTDDIITIADKVSGFIRDHQIGNESSSSSEESSEESSSDENNSGSEDEANIADELELNNEE